MRRGRSKQENKGHAARTDLLRSGHPRDLLGLVDVRMIEAMHARPDTGRVEIEEESGRKAR